MACTITGSIFNVGGTVAAGVVVRFVQVSMLVDGQVVVLPGIKSAVPDMNGVISVTLPTGVYILKIGDRAIGRIIVPSAPTANLEDLVDWGVTTLVEPVITWHQGAKSSLAVTIRSGNGAPPDMLGLSLYLLVKTPVGSIRIDADHASDPDADFDLDFSAHAIPTGTFDAQFWVNDGAGDTFLRDVAVRVIGGL